MDLSNYKIKISLQYQLNLQEWLDKPTTFFPWIPPEITYEEQENDIQVKNSDHDFSSVEFQR